MTKPMLAAAPTSCAEELEDSEKMAPKKAPMTMMTRPARPCRPPRMKRMTLAAFAPPGISMWGPGYPPGPPG